MKSHKKIFVVAQKHYTSYNIKQVCNTQINGQRINLHRFKCVCAGLCVRARACSNILCWFRALSNHSNTRCITRTDTRHVRWHSYDICDVFWQYKYGANVLPQPFIIQQPIPVTMRYFVCLLSALALCQSNRFPLHSSYSSVWLPDSTVSGFTHLQLHTRLTYV